MQVAVSTTCLLCCNVTLAVTPELTARAKMEKHLHRDSEIKKSKRDWRKGKSRENINKDRRRVSEGINSGPVANQSLLLSFILLFLAPWCTFAQSAEVTPFLSAAKKSVLIYDKHETNQKYSFLLCQEDFDDSKRKRIVWDSSGKTRKTDRFLFRHNAIKHPHTFADPLHHVTLSHAGPLTRIPGRIPGQSHEKGCFYVTLWISFCAWN